LTGKSHYQPRFSKAYHISFLGVIFTLGYVGYFGLYLHRAGRLNPSTFIVVVLIASLAGAAFGFVMWHLYFKRHRL
jgi:hypothetical protein